MDVSVDKAAIARRATPALVLSAVLFGSMAVAARGVSTHLSAPQIAAIRFGLGLLGMGVVALVRPSIFVATRPLLLFLRGFFGCVSVLGYFFAIQHVSAGMATLLNYTFPVWGALCAAFFLSERITRGMVAGMSLSLVGLAVVVDPSALLGAHPDRDPLFGWGILTGLLAGVSGGAATTAVRALRRHNGASASATFTSFCAVGLVVSAPLAWADWHPVTSDLWPLLGLIGVLSMAAQLLFTWALAHVRTGRGGMIQQLTVVASYSLAWLFLGEPIELHVILGAVLVMGGVLWVSLNSEQ